MPTPSSRSLLWYIDIDYRSEQYRGIATGPRDIELSDERQEPSWAHPACDSVDFAIEFLRASSVRFAASYERPGNREGIGLREVAAIGSAVRCDVDVAMWDVSQRSDWKDLLHSPVEAVDLRYDPQVRLHGEHTAPELQDLT